ncbi:26872_t:CDS:1 [Dentiscutata erythropus]|uniref:26872_t:CDS:1 n=1 Tax=Dentiscutata erythropus TaxID=1348616 RepID=A0A9N9B8W7_9GLOM|nr:26872_t:CDS:1 [Dentiscutata erythropus]
MEFDYSEQLVNNKKKFFILEEELPTASVLFPGSKAYEEANFIGNLLYRFKTPSAIVQAVTEEDVIATVLFAQKHGLKLTVKSGGHSYAGYCLNNGGIVLDISSMNKVSIDHKNMTVSIQGGAVWQDAYSLLKEKDQGLIIMGGQCPTVGASAFLLGAGLSPFSRSYGLGIDNLLEMTIITANGEKVTVTHEDVDPAKRDLFWAIRGGGGGNFGVTIGIKAKLHKLRDPNGIVVCGDLTWNLPDQEESFKAMMEVWNTTTWPNELCADAIWRYNDSNQLLGQLTIIYNGTMDQCLNDLAPLLKFNPGNDLKAMHWTDWEVKDASFEVFSQVYYHHGSFIFAEGAITSEVTNIIVKLMEEAKMFEPNSVSGCHILWDHIGGATTKFKPEETAFPWRDGVYAATIKAQWVDPAMHKKMFEFVDRAKALLLPHAIQGKAAYINYIDSTVENWQEAYYADNYPRLQKVKTHWDPTNFFQFEQSIEPVGHRKSHHRQPDWKPWGKYTLSTPQLLGNPKTNDQVYKTCAYIRRSIKNNISI